jgi:hypothetical protein
MTNVPATTCLQHPALAGWSWGAVIVEATYRASVVAYAYYKYPPSPLDIDHFTRNLGDRGPFVAIDVAILVVGAVMGLFGALAKNRKHWAAALGLIANLVAMSAALGAGVCFGPVNVA